MSIQASLTCACHTAGAKGLRAAKLVAEAMLCVLDTSEDSNTPLQVCSISALIPLLDCFLRDSPVMDDPVTRHDMRRRSRMRLLWLLAHASWRTWMVNCKCLTASAAHSGVSN